jgi:CRISPR system Cascade subunit CasB
LAQPAHRIVGPHLPAAVLDADGSVDLLGASVEIDAVERAFYTVAALIASQPRSARDEHLAKLAGQTETPGTDLAEVDSATDADAGEGAASAASAGNEPQIPEHPGSGEETKRRSPERSRSLGRCLAEAVNRTPRQEQTEAYSRLEARLRLMCRQDVDGLHRHLPRLVQYLRSDQVDIDWVRLLIDCARWGVDADTIAKTWLQNFYGTARPAFAGVGSGPDSDDADGTDGAVEDSESERS